jgi:hypothetical protein
MLVHPNQRSRVHERLDDGRQRAVAVVVVARDCPAGEIEMNPEFALILGDVGSGESLDSVGFDRQN